MTDARRFVVGAADDGNRLDQFVAACAGVSAAAARRLIEAGRVRVSGRPVNKGVRLSVGVEVEVAGLDGAAPAVVPDPDLQVLVVYVDQHLVAIDKPAGVPSHPLQPGERGTAANAIVARFPDCADASLDPREGGLGHRLDTATSGVLIAARSRTAWSGLRRALGADDCEKRYLCEVWGAPPDQGRVDAEIGRAGRRGRVVRVSGGRQPRAAATAWTVVARGPDTALVEARLHAGRAHQVRAHLASAGFPLVGDDRYGGVHAPATAGAAATLHLHAASVQFRHPVTGAALVISAPHPPWARLEAFTGVR